MIGEEDVGVWDFGAVVGHVAVFALGGGLAHGFAAAIVLDNFFSVEPMLDVVALDADAGMVPFTGGMERLVPGRRDNGIKGAGAGFFITRAPIVQQLVFVPGRARVFGDEVFHAAVAIGSDAPLPLEIEVGKFLTGDNVATVKFGDFQQTAIGDQPAGGGELLLADAAPLIGGGAVEQQLPTFGAFRIAQSIGLARPKHRRGKTQRDASIFCTHVDEAYARNRGRVELLTILAAGVSRRRFFNHGGHGEPRSDGSLEAGVAGGSAEEWGEGAALEVVAELDLVLVLLKQRLASAGRGH